MRPGLNKEILRGRTAYRVGRVVADILLLLQLVGVLILLFLFFAGFFGALPVLPVLMLDSAFVASAVVSTLATFLLRDLAHAIFDIADRALIGAATAHLREQESLSLSATKGSA